MRKDIDELVLKVSNEVIDMSPMTARKFVPGVTSAFLDGAPLSESELEAIRKVIYAAALTQ